ncbi:WD40 repeat-like protein, partial [Piromyces finnis]
MKQMIDLSELYFILYQFLKGSPLQQTANQLKEELENYQKQCILNNENSSTHLIQPRYDWEGHAHPKTLEDIEKEYPAIPQKYLLDLLNKFIKYVNDTNTPVAPNISTLLPYNKSVAPLRDHIIQEFPKDLTPKSINEWLKQKHNPLSLSYYQYNIHPTNNVLSLHSRELCGMNISEKHPLRFTYKNYEKLVEVKGHNSETFCLLIDRIGKRFITGGDDGIVKIWCMETGWLIYSLRGHTGVIFDMAINNDNTMLATSSNDETIRIWNLRTSALISVLKLSLPPRKKDVTHLVFSPSPSPTMNCLLAIADDGIVRVWRWNRTTKKYNPEPQIFDCKTIKTTETYCADFNATGTKFAVGGTDGYIRVFSFLPSSFDEAFSYKIQLDPQEIARLEGHQSHIIDIRFSHKDNRIASGSKDGNCIIWTFNFKTKTWDKMELIYTPDPNENSRSGNRRNHQRQAITPITPSIPSTTPTNINSNNDLNSNNNNNNNNSTLNTNNTIISPSRNSFYIP